MTVWLRKTRNHKIAAKAFPVKVPLVRGKCTRPTVNIDNIIKYALCDRSGWISIMALKIGLDIKEFQSWDKFYKKPL